MASTDHHPPKRIHSVSIRLDDDTRDRLRVISRRDNRTVSNLVFLIVREWLDANDEEEIADKKSKSRKR